MKDYDNMQDANWGWGVFYATDSNSGDQRCRNLQSDKGWDCPGHWIDRSGNVTADSSKKGAGGYQPGNPYHSGGGGGAGCHFDLTAKKMDQQDATGSLNLVQA